MAEMGILTNTEGEHGRNSGRHRQHGDQVRRQHLVFEFLRNNWLDARNF
jgi:hypothetical protein